MINFLIGISPSGFITFLSDTDGGRASHKFNCRYSGFLDCLGNSDEVMTDQEFQITEQLMFKSCTLSVTPTASIK